jgi:hypothetical protein
MRLTHFNLHPTLPLGPTPNTPTGLILEAHPPLLRPCMAAISILLEKSLFPDPLPHPSTNAHQFNATNSPNNPLAHCGTESKLRLAISLTPATLYGFIGDAQPLFNPSSSAIH